MLVLQFIKKLTLEQCREHITLIKAELELTDRRLSRLINTKAKNPSWDAYDKYADDVVGIDIRIEEQQAVYEELTDCLTLLDKRINRPKQLAML